jgi:hypothetical protein
MLLEFGPDMGKNSWEIDEIESEVVERERSYRMSFPLILVNNNEC